MPLKRCNASRCRVLIDWSSKYCDEHKGYQQKQYNKDVRYNRDNKEQYSYYHSKEWKGLREAKLLESHFRCAMCKEEGKSNRSNRLIVHHKHMELKDVLYHKSARTDLNNLEVLCQYHHNQITFGKGEDEVSEL